VSGLFATYRKDRWLPESQYNEVGTQPLNGGRFHIAGISSVTGDVTGLRLNGQSATVLQTQPMMLEWFHVWPQRVTAGEPIWVAFHSRDAAWDTASSAAIVVTTSAGDALNGSFPVARTSVPITYVTTADQGTTLLIHLHNDDTVTRTLTRLLVDGRDVTASGQACVPSTSIAAGASALFTVRRCSAATSGAPWTVVAEFQGTPASVAVGRFVPERFPIEAWTQSADCAWPGLGNTASSYAMHRDAGFESAYVTWGNNCATSGPQLVNTILPPLDFHALLTDGFLDEPNPGAALTTLSRVEGVLIGDEVDSTIWENNQSKPGRYASKTKDLWSLYPTLPVYVGSKTNKNVGAFAGVADIQGGDFYVAGCAPHITQWGTHPPLRGAYDYLRNVRDNHTPLPTWLYAQGLSVVWNKQVLGRQLRIQADPQEIVVQAVSALAAGAKGLMWFQTNLSEARADPSRWDAIVRMNWLTRGLRRHLREGDLTGMASTPSNALVEAIRSRDAIVVTVIGLNTTSAPTDPACAAAAVGGPVPHFSLAAQTASVTVEVPPDFAVTELFEATDRGPGATPSFSVQGRRVTITNIMLSDATAARVFVLARTGQVRGELTAATAR
jgi:uncharacterized Zn-binding protein involved in type VI secretion